MNGVLDPDRRNLAALGIVAVALVVVSVLAPSPGIRYGAWLAIFTVWMIWFVLAVVGWLRNADV